MISQAAQWIAPVATMIAAMMTAANLGARVTGWGFVVFSVGAAAWVMVAVASGQQNLLVSNGFLLVVDLVGVWRWLGREARYDEGAKAAEAESAVARAPDLLAVGKIAGRPVRDESGASLGTIVDVMAGCGDGAIRYVVVSIGGVGGVGETLHAIGWDELRVEGDALVSRVASRRLARRRALSPDEWPASAAEAGVG